MDTRIVKAADNESGTLTATLSSSETTTIHLTPVPDQAPGIIVLNPGDTTEEHILYVSRDAGSGTVSGLTRDYSGLNGGTGREHTNGSSWETMQASAYVNNIVDALTSGFVSVIATISKVSDTSFTISGNVTSTFTAGRIIQMNGSVKNIVVSSSYSSGTGLTTVTVLLSNVPTLTLVEYSSHVTDATVITAVQTGSYAIAGGTANALTVTLAPAPTALTSGMVVRVMIATTNTAAATLNVNGLGAKDIRKNGTTALAAGDLVAGTVATMVYDGTVWQVTATNAANAAAGQYGTDTGGDDAYDVTLSPAPTAYYPGMAVTFLPTTGNTGACTLNVNGLGAVTIKKDGSKDTDTGDILAGRATQVVYDGTNFQLPDRRPYWVEMSLSADQNPVTDNTITRVTLNAIGDSAGGAAADVNTGTYRWTCPVAGVYRVTARATIKQTAAAAKLYEGRVYIYKNNSSWSEGTDFDYTGNMPITNPMTERTLNLVAGDYIEMFVLIDTSDSTAGRVIGGLNYTSLTITRL